MSKTLSRFLVAPLFLLSFAASAGEPPADLKISREETALAQLINQAREQAGKPRIPISNSLSYIAQLQAEEFEESGKRVTDPMDGFYWDRINELTGYGYTTWAAYSRVDRKSEQPMHDVFTGVMNHEVKICREKRMSDGKTKCQWETLYTGKELILTTGYWAEVSDGEPRQVNAMGIGVRGETATIWFGEGVDPHGSPAQR